MFLVRVGYFVALNHALSFDTEHFLLRRVK